MRNCTIDYKDKQGSVLAKLFVTHTNIDHISLDIRWALNEYDYNGNGHYRCEILNGNITEEVLPDYADYDVLMRWKDEMIANLDFETKNIIKIAFQNKQIEPERF